MEDKIDPTRIGDQQGQFSAIGRGYLTRNSILNKINKPNSDRPLIEWGKYLKSEKADIDEYVGSWYCDLHMGQQVFHSSEKHLLNLEWEQDFDIEPGQFGLLITEEKVNIPAELVGFISLRLSVALQGLINISGRHVDPWYSGKLVFSVYNAGSTPVIIKRGDPIFMIAFAYLDYPAPMKKSAKFVNIESIRPEWMRYVRGPPVSLQALDTRLNSLDLKFNILISILSAIFVAVLIILLSHI